MPQPRDLAPLLGPKGGIVDTVRSLLTTLIKNRSFQAYRASISLLTTHYSLLRTHYSTYTPPPAIETIPRKASGPLKALRDCQSHARVRLLKLRCDRQCVRY